MSDERMEVVLGVRHPTLAADYDRLFARRLAAMSDRELAAIGITRRPVHSPEAAASGTSTGEREREVEKTLRHIEREALAVHASVLTPDWISEAVLGIALQARATLAAAPLIPTDDEQERGAMVLYACLRELEPSFLHDWETEGERTREGFIEAFRKAQAAVDEWRRP